MPPIKFLLILLFLPFWLILGIAWNIYQKFWGEKENQKSRKNQEMKLTQFKKKQLEYIRNFSPVRLKNRCWRIFLKKEKWKSLLSIKTQFSLKKKKTAKK